MFKSENFLLTFYAPSPFPSPRWGEGKGVRRKFQIYLAGIIANIIFKDHEPLMKGSATKIWVDLTNLFIWWGRGDFSRPK